MSKQTGKHVMAILPDTFSHDERGVRIQLLEDLHPLFLRIDEAMLLPFVECMRSNNTPAFSFESFRQNGLHFGLFGPAFLIGGKAKVAVG